MLKELFSVLLHYGTFQSTVIQLHKTVVMLSHLYTTVIPASLLCGIHTLHKGMVDILLYVLTYILV